MRLVSDIQRFSCVLFPAVATRSAPGTRLLRTLAYALGRQSHLRARILPGMRHGSLAFPATGPFILVTISIQKTGVGKRQTAAGAISRCLLTASQGRENRRTPLPIGAPCPRGTLALPCRFMRSELRQRPTGFKYSGRGMGPFRELANRAMLETGSLPVPSDRGHCNVFSA